MTSLFDRVTIAKPCPASWDAMTGDDKVRFCDLCDMNVFNLSAMSIDEAEVLIRKSGEERICGRLYQRADGTMLTQDCPVGLAAVVRKRVAAFASSAVALFALFLGVLGFRTTSDSMVQGRMLPVIDPIEVVVDPVELMGEVCVEPEPQLESVPDLSEVRMGRIRIGE